MFHARTQEEARARRSLLSLLCGEREGFLRARGFREACGVFALLHKVGELLGEGAERPSSLTASNRTVRPHDCGGSEPRHCHPQA